MFACLYYNINTRIFSSKALNFINSLKENVSTPSEYQAHHFLCSNSLLLSLYTFMLLVWKTFLLLNKVNPLNQAILRIKSKINTIFQERSTHKNVYQSTIYVNKNFSKSKFPKGMLKNFIIILKMIKGI